MSGLSGLNTAAAAALTGMGGTLSNMSSSFANTGSSTDALTQAYSGIQQYAGIS